MATHVSGTEFDNGVVIPVNEVIRNEMRGLYQLNWHHSLEGLSAVDKTLPWGIGKTLVKFWGGASADFSRITLKLIADERYCGELQEVGPINRDFEYWLAPGIIAIITNTTEYGDVSLMISRTGNDFGDNKT